jgi:alcohol dehydrogenase
MRAVYFEEFKKLPTIATVPDPTPTPGGVVLDVRASGLCRSDWHGWMGHDADVKLPHVPGHEYAGVVAAVGAGVTKWKVGDRVTAPFCLGCGHCHECQSGHQHICDNQVQAGFGAWGSYADYVAVSHADINLVRVPESMSFVTAASLGCRFITSFSAVVDKGRAKPGEWLAVYGCGGVGLSAIMIGTAMGAKVIAIDIDDAKLALAKSLGARYVINSRQHKYASKAVRDISGGGAHLSIDALGHTETCVNSIHSLRKRGRHVQVGLMLAEDATPAIPMGRVIGMEIEIKGSHGMQAHRYDDMFRMISRGLLKPELLVGKTIPLADAPQALADMAHFPGTGITVIDRDKG